MLRRNLVVSYKPSIKSNSVVLSELNHRLMNLSDTGNSCLNITNNQVDHYCSWLPYGGQTIRDTEIGMNASVAEALGLHDGSIVSCKVVDELPVLDTVYVTAVNQKDWEMLEATSYRIQNTLLDQTRIINKGQKLVVWVNKAIHITIKIDEVSPKVKYGKIENNTEFVVTPFKENLTNGSAKKSDVIDVPKPQKEKASPKRTEANGTTNSTPSDDLNRGSLYERLFSKGTKKSDSDQSNGGTRVIDSTTLDNVSVKESSDDDSDSSDSDYSVYDGNNQSINSSRRSSPSRSSPPPQFKTQSKTQSKPQTKTQSSAQPKSKPLRLDVQSRLFDALLTELKNQDRKHYQFRAVPRKWTESQMCDLFMTQHNKPETFDANIVYVMSCESINDNDERVTKEYYVSVKPAMESDTFPKNIYPTVEVNDILMAHLNLQKFSRVTLSTKKTVLNLAEKIELIPSTNSTIKHLKQIEESFKLMLIKNTRNTPMLINQGQIFKLCDGDVIVSAKIYPEAFRYCLCDGEILRENKIAVSEQKKDLSTVFVNAEDVMKHKEHNEDDSGGGFTANDCFVHLNEFEGIVKDCVENIVVNTCLDERNCLRKVNNYLIVGPQTTGKSTICKEILKRLEQPPYHCHVEVFHCAQNKARKTESIQKDLRAILSLCVEKAPAVLLLDNLDTLAKTVVEHSHDGDYYNRVSDVIQHLISSFTSQNGIAVIATISNKNNLNQRLHTSRGNHLFQKVYKIPDLQKEDRKKIIQELCQNDQIKCHKINYEKFANLTEGYTIGYLLQFIDRAVFYAYRNDNNNPTITNEVLINSMKTTNTYCLQGIENNIKLEDCDDSDDETSAANKFAGLDSVVRVFEEVLIWPTKYTEIFDNSPLRNQAGILLYGPPGTGKTYLVSQISRFWNLRMISVKGPELLAKFIGQSEENVRNLFDRARSARPCVLFFDEFDSIAPRRGHDSTGVTDRVVNQLLTELDGVEALQGVIVIAATSRPDLLDPALLRSGRIDRLVQCSLPDSEARLAIFKSIAQASSLKLKPDVKFEYFCDDKSDNYTGADIKSILVSANMIAVKECLANDPEDVPEEIFIGQKHLMDAFTSTRPSLSYQDAIKYKSLYARFMKKEQPSRDFVSQRATLA